MAQTRTRRRPLAQRVAAAVSVAVLAAAQWLGIVTACSSSATEALAAQPGQTATIANGREIDAASDYYPTITYHYDAESGDALLCVEHGITTAPGEAVVQDIVGQTTHMMDWETKNNRLERTWTQQAVTDCALIRLYAEEHYSGDDAIAFAQCFVWSYVRAGFDIDGTLSWPQYIPYRFQGERQALVDFVKASRGAWEGRGLLYTKTNGNQMVAKFWAEPATGDLELRKSSADESVSANNPCYSLEGAVFGVYRDEACADEAARLTTDAGGRAKASGLRAGTYWVREIEAPEGYALDEGAHRVEVPKGAVALLQASDAPQTCPVGVALAKLDAETGLAAPYGAASLEGAEFRVDFYAGLYGADDLPEAPARTFVVSTGADGTASLGQELPLGTVAIQETKAPTGYVANTRKFLVHITSDGNAPQVDTYNAPDVAEERVRGGLSFTKADEDSQRRMANVAFRLTCADTGESHILVTDENGRFDSGEVEDPAAANGNDAALKDDGTIDSSRLDPAAGVWFGETRPVTGKGALPYGTYLLEELRCDANQGHRLVSASVCVRRDGKTYRLGTFDDKEVAIETTLAGAGGEKTCPAAQAELTDTVRYEGLERGHEYRLEGELHDIDDSGVDQGAVATAEVLFTPQMGTGEQAVSFSVDAGALGGHRLVAYEYLWDGDDLLCGHDDPSDEDQSVRVPLIATELTGDAGHEADATAQAIVLTDAVAYRNLEPGQAYTLTGTLRLKGDDGTDAGAALDDDGREITASAELVPEARDGVAQVTFEFRGTGLVGREAVAFETLEKGGRAYAVHADIEDASQLVSFPVLATTATSELTGDHDLPATGSQKVSDLVQMRGLCAGSEYELRSELHLRGESGEDEGAVASASLAFVAEGPEASRAVELGVDASRFAGKTLVAFEELYRDGKRVGSHADISDEAQSVCVPAIRTALTAPGGEKTVSVGQAGSAVELTDTVEYTGLVPGKAYRLEGTLHARSGDRADAGALLDREGKPVEASAEFVAEASSGSCSVSFSVDASALAGRSAVAFERLLAGDVQLASHEDIGDEAQTVSFEEGPGTPGTPAATPQTGDKALPFFACAVLGGLLAFCAASIHHASRLREKDR